MVNLCFSVAEGARTYGCASSVAIADVDRLILIGTIRPHGDEIAHLPQLKQVHAMNNARARLIRLHRDVRQITWMVAATIVLELVLLVKGFWGQ